MSAVIVGDVVATASLLPREAHRAVQLEVIATQLAAAIDGTRYGAGTIDSAVVSFFEEHQIALPEGRTAARTADEIMLTIFADEIYDSELEQAMRASISVLREIFPERIIQASGWIRGTEIRRGLEVFTLTSNECPECEINPECYGPSGGIRCLDTRNCGWWFCF